MSERSLHHARIVSVVAATLISLACGTNYIYSAWGPQFAERMKLSSTESNLIAVSGNLGMYACGIPIGFIVDRRGARPGTLIGSFMIGGGYFFLHRAYMGGQGSIALPWLCLFMFFTGAGGAASFAGSIKTSALNWPEHRGTATAFPLSAFGLSAFFFAFVSHVATPGDTADFLLVLMIGTFCLIFIPTFFLRVVPHVPAYSLLPNQPSGPSRTYSRQPSRVTSADSKKSLLYGPAEPGTQYSAVAGLHSSGSSQTYQGSQDMAVSKVDEDEDAEGEDENDDHLESGTHAVDNGQDNISDAHVSLYADVRGLALLRTVEFYQYFLLLGLLTGVGLMTINNIGNDAQALWSHWDNSVSLKWIRQRQSIHVSVLSICSFCGRLLSGIGSDLIVKKLHLSRIWCLFISSLIFFSAQLVGIGLENPNFLVLLSGLTGLAYGFLFGCFPSIIAGTFGINGLSQNWGCMTLAPVVFTNIFNLIYGSVFDRHSKIRPDGNRSCSDGRYCYQSAYWVTFSASIVAMCISLWSIWYQRGVKAKMQRKGEALEDDHLA